MKMSILSKLIAVLLSTTVSQTPGEWRIPVASPAHLIANFRSPNSDYSAGHRGVDFLVSEGQALLAPSEGRVAFSGSVAGRSVLAIQHNPSLRTALEPACSQLPVGDRVVAGQIIGYVCGRGYASHCAPRICLHYSLRSDGRYLSPLALTGGLAPSVLIPAN
jgi:murein DD-endopeptidase MepM/ murein hydrolase activator NlpD